MKNEKYFLAVLPPANISAEILGFQKKLEVKFGAVHAQKVMPHITVIPPFNGTADNINSFHQNLKHYLKNLENKPIQIQLDNFQRFDNRTLFVDVAKNEKFELLCKSIKLLFNAEKIIPQRVEKHFFVPHITIANKDLKKKDFKLAWEMIQKEKKFERNFELEEFSLFKSKDKKWEITQRISFTTDY